MAVQVKRDARFDACGRVRRAGLYDPSFEHDSCGVGFVARLRDEPLHEVVEKAVSVLVNLEHRGAVGGDQATGDGAGLLLDMPDEFMRSVSETLGFALPPVGEYAAGMIFLPRAEKAAERCMAALEGAVKSVGAEVLGWREVPVQTGNIGDLARQTEPLFRQLLVARGSLPTAAFEPRLYLARRLAEEEVESWDEAEYRSFHIASLSSRTLVYKGMLTGTQLAEVFPDILDPSFKVRYSIVHQRYSTNTLPAWHLAQPFRMLAHNGEINTLRGNINRMRSREPHLSCTTIWDPARGERLPSVVMPGLSDSACFDAVLQLLTAAGRSLPHAVMMMVPEAWGEKYHISRDLRAFYDYHSALMEPWDGPAALVFTDGRYLGATLDRNGLRPARYAVTDDGYVVLASETGVLEMAPDKVHSLGRLQPGRMLLIDLEQQRIVPDREIKARIARRQPYRHWLEANSIELRGLLNPPSPSAVTTRELVRTQHVFGYSREELKLILEPMVVNAQEPVGSMGNDEPPAVLAERPQLMFDYFKQLFAQVTNPPIDPLREELVMSLMSYLGRERNLLDETPQHCRQLKLRHPVLTPEDIDRIRGSRHADLGSADLDILFPVENGAEGLRAALRRIGESAEQAIQDAASLLILTDRNMDRQNAPIPALLAVSALHHHLLRCGLRNQVGIIVESGEPREVMHFAMLIGFGANAVCPYTAMATARRLAEEDMLSVPCPPEKALDNYIAAVKKGLLKTFSRMGISTIRSFMGAQTFQSVGLAGDLIDSYFPGAGGRIGGAGLAEIAAETIQRHRLAFPVHGSPPSLLEIGGRYAVRRQGAAHLLTAEAVIALQYAVREGDYGKFKDYAALIDDQSCQRMTLRSLFQLRPVGDPVPLAEVEPASSIVQRFFCSAMSFGSLSREAHETLAAGCNRVGARSNSGEGGEDPARYRVGADGLDRSSRVKQIASGRFGVSTQYAISCDELQIKMAQGAKPGEGGQLPGHKVTAEIARVRNTTAGVTLISPPPHHDIYSIEDLAQLVYDLKCVNRNARVSVKLVSEAGVGTVAAGVAKAKADMVQIAGGDGGTGASPLSAIKHCGLPWELGLAETWQTLQLQGLRDKIRIQVDGQLRTGRDLVVAALLGAEEFGFATIMLVSIGCVMMRKCHNNTCPVGVATQDPRLRKFFTGKPEHVENLLLFLAENMREWMSELGFRTVDQMIGRLDALDAQPAIEHGKAQALDFSALLRPDYEWREYPVKCMREKPFVPVQCFDDGLISGLQPALDQKQPMVLDLPIRNVDRTVGARLSAEVVRRHGSEGLPEDTIVFNFTGSAGQSFGAFLAPGITMRVYGDANDYLGKSMSGGRIIVRPAPRAKVVAHENIIVGNVVLYGAHRGEVYINGLAGERFAVRNSGADAVVEGVGDHGCEYMTGGAVVILGPTGNNFAAGMSGGVAYVYDESGLFDTRCNLDMVDLETVHESEDVERLKRMLRHHQKYTGSARARHVLRNWGAHVQYFVKVMPIDYRRALERMRREQRRDSETISATEEVYDG